QELEDRCLTCESHLPRCVHAAVLGAAVLGAAVLGAAVCATSWAGAASTSAVLVIGGVREVDGGEGQRLREVAEVFTSRPGGPQLAEGARRRVSKLDHQIRTPGGDGPEAGRDHLTPLRDPPRDVEPE